MIKIVPDANVILSGMLGPTATRRILNFALAKRIVLYGSETTYQEFCEKIQISRFTKYLDRQLFSPEKIILDYRSLITMVDTSGVYAGATITRDPDDDEYLRVAKAANCQIIVTRDNDILSIKKYDGIVAVTPEKFLKSFFKLSEGKLP